MLWALGQLHAFPSDKSVTPSGTNGRVSSYPCSAFVPLNGYLVHRCFKHPPFSCIHSLPATVSGTRHISNDGKTFTDLVKLICSSDSIHSSQTACYMPGPIPDTWTTATSIIPIGNKLTTRQC